MIGFMPPPIYSIPSPPPRCPNCGEILPQEDFDFFKGFIAFCAGIALVIFFLIPFALGAMDESLGESGGTSLVARFIQHIPTYGLARFLFEPRP